MEAQKFLKNLQAGNERFKSGLPSAPPHKPVESGSPKAVVISCMDARVAPEIIFDQPLGNFFSLRIAGNMITNEIAESAALGCKASGCSLIIVIGHTDCAAVKTTIANLNNNKPSGFLSSIANVADKNSDVDKLALAHVKDACKTLKNHESIQRLEREITILGGMYEVHSGNIEFFT